MLVISLDSNDLSACLFVSACLSVRSIRLVRKNQYVNTAIITNRNAKKLITW